MKARKLPSGNWNVRVPVGTDKDGKVIYKSITERKKDDALRKAALYDVRGGDIRVGEMVLRYIMERREVLSPSTYRSYIGIYNASIKDDVFARFQISTLSDTHAQRWVSRVAKDKSPKTVKNTYFLFSAALKYFYPRMDIRVRLPQMMRPVLHTPKTSEVKLIIDLAKERDFELYKAILLGSAGMMRRGEIAALTADDLDFKRNIVSVTKSQVRLAEGGYTIKPPKTDSSNRFVRLPQFVMDVLPHSGKVVDLTIAQITNRFIDLVKASGLPHFRFHDLRHYGASVSVSSSVGASTSTVKDRGGWATDGMMKRVYINSLDDEVDKDTQAINDFFTEQFAK